MVGPGPDSSTLGLRMRESRYRSGRNDRYAMCGIIIFWLGVVFDIILAGLTLTVMPNHQTHGPHSWLRS